MYIHKKCGIVKGSKIQSNNKATVLCLLEIPPNLFHPKTPNKNSTKLHHNRYNPGIVSQQKPPLDEPSHEWNTMKWFQVAKENIPSLPRYLQDGPVIKGLTTIELPLFLSDRHDSWLLLTSRKRSRGNKNNMFQFDWISLEQRLVKYVNSKDCGVEYCRVGLHAVEHSNHILD